MKNKISKTKIEKRLKKKTNPELVRTLIKLKKTNPAVAKALAVPRKLQRSFNLGYLNKIGKDVLVAGKVLGEGNLNKKIKVVGVGGE